MIGVKYHITNKNGVYGAQSFNTFDEAWDFIESYIPEEIHHEIYVISSEDIGVR